MPAISTSLLQRTSWVVLLAAAVAMTLGDSTADESTPSPADPVTASREQALRQIRDEIARLESQLDVMRRRESGLEDELKRTRVELRLQETRLDEATAARDLAAAKAQAAQAKVDELEAALGATRDDLRRRLTGLYRLGRHGYLRLFLSLEPDQSLLPAIRQLRFLVQRDRVALDRYAATAEQLRVQRLTLEAELRDMEDWQRREEERRNELAAVRRRQERLLEQIAEERRTLAARTDALQDKERKLSDLVQGLLGASPTPLDGTPIQRFRGALDWPVRGKVVARFGPRRDPRYRTEIPHNGVDLTPDLDGAEVRAIFPGEVLFASAFEGYGRMVVVHHPGRVFSLYSGLRELRVTKGDVLSLGRVLGVAGGEIYFEIRHENQPEDPLLWLR